MARFHLPSSHHRLERPERASGRARRCPVQWSLGATHNARAREGFRLVTRWRGRRDDDDNDHGGDNDAPHAAAPKESPVEGGGRRRRRKKRRLRRGEAAPPACGGARAAERRGCLLGRGRCGRLRGWSCVGPGGVETLLRGGRPRRQAMRQVCPEAHRPNAVTTAAQRQAASGRHSRRCSLLRERKESCRRLVHLTKRSFRDGRLPNLGNNSVCGTCLWLAADCCECWRL